MRGTKSIDVNVAKKKYFPHQKVDVPPVAAEQAHNLRGKANHEDIEVRSTRSPHSRRIDQPLVANVVYDRAYKQPDHLPQTDVAEVVQCLLFERGA